MKETRIAITLHEACAMISTAQVVNTSYVVDNYSGTSRTRLVNGSTTTKDYTTPVTGIIHRFSTLLEVNGVSDVWLEFKLTESVSRWEVEFEGEVPRVFQGRENISGWDIFKV